MRRKNILFLGFGDLARRACAQLTGHRRVGVARSRKPMPEGAELWLGAIEDEPMLARLAQEHWDAVVVTLTPAAHTDEAYRQAYVATLESLLPVWRAQPPGLVLWASSTGVYGQSDGSWVDETSPAEPSSFSGRRLLEAEALLQSSGLPVSVLRCAGIYGPGRDFLIRQVRERKGGSSDYTNRIHAEDCAGFIAHLLNRHHQGLPVEPLYLACDSEPATGEDVRRWLAGQLGIPTAELVPSESLRAGSKRCCNRRMLASGYSLVYPSFREGYSALLGKS